MIDEDLAAAQHRIAELEADVSYLKAQLKAAQEENHGRRCDPNLVKENAELKTALAKETEMLETSIAAHEIANRLALRAMEERNDLKKLVNKQADELSDLRYQLGTKE